MTSGHSSNILHMNLINLIPADFFRMVCPLNGGVQSGQSVSLKWRRCNIKVPQPEEIFAICYNWLIFVRAISEE